MANNDYWAYLKSTNELCHYGILGQKWGMRRFQNEDGSLTPEGEIRYRKKLAQMFAKRDKAYARSDRLSRKATRLDKKANRAIKKSHRSSDSDDIQWYNNKYDRFARRSNRNQRRANKADRTAHRIEKIISDWMETYGNLPIRDLNADKQ